MEHLLNCHGEWAAVTALLSSLPLIGTYLKLKLRPKNESRKDKELLDGVE